MLTLWQRHQRRAPLHLELLESCALHNACSMDRDQPPNRTENSIWGLMLDRSSECTQSSGWRCNSRSGRDCRFSHSQRVSSWSAAQLPMPVKYSRKIRHIKAFAHESIGTPMTTDTTYFLGGIAVSCTDRARASGVQCSCRCLQNNCRSTKSMEISVRHRKT